MERVWRKIERCNPVALKINQATGKEGIMPLVHFVARTRILVYGDPADRLDDQMQLSELVSNKALKDFRGLVIEKFGRYTNRCPSAAQKWQVLEPMGRREFPEFFGSRDCKE